MIFTNCAYSKYWVMNLLEFAVLLEWNNIYYDDSQINQHH
jgi:hypothetical protein